MKMEMTYGELMCLYFGLFGTIHVLRENKRHDHQRYGDEFDERHDRAIQVYADLAEKLYDMLEEDQER